MGSTLSGRQDGKPLVEDCLTLDLAALMRRGPVREGHAWKGESRWSVDGQLIASIRYRLDLRDARTARLMLKFRFTSSAGPKPDFTQTITLDTTSQNFGGRRWWMRCPITGKRARTLHLPAGADRFASRAAWGLAYKVERVSHFDRPFEKFFRVQRRLGQPQGLFYGLVRPKGMWHRTFARHAERLMAAELECINGIAALIEKT